MHDVDYITTIVKREFENEYEAIEKLCEVREVA